MSSQNKLAVILPAWHSDLRTFAVYYLTQEDARKWHTRMREVNAHGQSDEEFCGTIWWAKLIFYDKNKQKETTRLGRKQARRSNQLWREVVETAERTNIAQLIAPNAITAQYPIEVDNAWAEVGPAGIIFRAAWTGGDAITGVLDLSTILYARLYFEDPAETNNLLTELAQVAPEMALDLLEHGFRIPGISNKGPRTKWAQKEVIVELLNHPNRSIRERTLLLVKIMENPSKRVKRTTRG